MSCSICNHRNQLGLPNITKTSLNIGYIGQQFASNYCARCSKYLKEDLPRSGQKRKGFL